MKRKFVLILFVVLLVIVKMVNAAGLHELTVCEDPTKFCQYQGMLGNLDEVDKEFAMLLESPNHPNFQSMYTTVSQLLEKVRTSEKHLEVLRNPECNVSKYTRKLLTCYEANKEKIKENTKNESLGQDIIAVFESLKEKVGTGFLSTMILDNLRIQMHTACMSPTGDVGHHNCKYTTSRTLMELINTVQVLAKELEQLKRQNISTPLSTSLI
jgi:hypothetical protein